MEKKQIQVHPSKFAGRLTTVGDYATHIDPPTFIAFKGEEVALSLSGINIQAHGWVAGYHLEYIKTGGQAREGNLSSEYLVPSLKKAGQDAIDRAIDWCKLQQKGKAIISELEEAKALLRDFSLVPKAAKKPAPAPVSEAVVQQEDLAALPDDEMKKNVRLFQQILDKQPSAKKAATQDASKPVGKKPVGKKPAADDKK